jgi:hypothetical protein
MHITAMRRPAKPDEFVDERHQWMARCAVTLGQPIHVEPLVLAVLGDHFGRRCRDHA